jgi:hypothetical protein
MSPLNWNRWIRQAHRWISIAFTVAVILNGVAVARGRYTSRLGLMVVLPLALLMLTGICLFALPFVSQGHAARNAGWV